MRSPLSTLVRATVPAIPGHSMTTSSPIFSYFSSKDSPVGKEGRSSPKAAVKPKPQVYNSNITGSGSDPRSQLTTAQNQEVDEHNRHFTKERAREDGTNDKGGTRH
ncbi:umta methyltransferase [Trichoderma arundinaceum]|uniref:Umta methyltransferase n=1 Tax=Trichoderma arundinaceum TaxID=490622 RepID=A0A395NNV9_TRIAR|nr:umta methyltransferase [Trichoderma arundinaceum]